MSSNSNKTSQPTGGSTSGTSGNTSGVKSKYAMVKDGWGTRNNFQLSMGLGLDPEGYEEGNRILESFQEADRKADQSSRK